jgi:hypothetical protein
MMQKNNVINLNSYQEVENDFIKEMIKNLNQKFFKKFSIENIKLEINDEKLYKNFQYLLKNKEKSLGKNQHQDLANFRLFFEANLIIRNFKLIDGIINAYIIDVGASTRLYNYMIARLILRPTLDCQDSVRTNKFTMNYNLILDMTFQQFIGKYYSKIKKYKPIFNFTDVLYYINEVDLIRYTKNMNDGLIGMGTLHIFKNHSLNTIQNLLDLGIITMSEHQVNMKVIGNETVYKHNVIFSCLKDMDYYNIKAGDYYLNIIKQLSVDLGATVYISFLIVKSNNFMISPTFIKEQSEVLIDEQKQKDYIKKAVLNYKLSYKLSFNDLLEEEHLNNLIIRFLYNVSLNKIYERLKEVIIQLNLEQHFS